MFSPNPQKGQSLLEYALILLLVVMIVIVVVFLLGPVIADLYSNIISEVP